MAAYEAWAKKEEGNWLEVVKSATKLEPGYIQEHSAVIRHGWKGSVLQLSGLSGERGRIRIRAETANKELNRAQLAILVPGVTGNGQGVLRESGPSPEELCRRFLRLPAQR